MVKGCHIGAVSPSSSSFLLSQYAGVPLIPPSLLHQIICNYSVEFDCSIAWTYAIDNDVSIVRTCLNTSPQLFTVCIKAETKPRSL